MAKDYKSIFIPNHVIFIVDQDGAAFMTDASNKNTIETGRNWAKGYSYYNKENSFVPPEHVYPNGKFKVCIDSAAGRSCQGGKLSFWSCLVTTPDNLTFKVGINAEVLCELLLHNTFVNGKCEEDVWFGTQNKQNGLYTKNMPSYQDYVVSNNLREDMKQKQTIKYLPGEEVRTLTGSQVYVGTLYKYFDTDLSSNRYRREYELTVNIYKTPKIVHVFGDDYGKSDLYISTYNFTVKRPKRLQTGKTYQVDGVLEKWLKTCREETLKKIHANEYVYYPEAFLTDVQFGLEDTYDLDIIKSRFKILQTVPTKSTNYFKNLVINYITE